MEIMAAIFIANNTEEAIQYDPLKQNLNCINANGLTDYEISILWAKLDGSKHIKEKHSLTFIEIESDNILYEFPNNFVNALINVEGNNLLTVASHWAEHEDLNWRQPQALKKLEDIIMLAKRAKQTHQKLYLILI